MAIVTKKRPLSSLQLKIKADIVEKTKHDISTTKNPKPTIITTNLEKEGITPEQAFAILQLAIDNKLDTNDVYAIVLDKIHISESPLANQIYEIMQPNIWTKKFTPQVLDLLLTTMTQLRSEKAFNVIDEMIRVGMAPNVKKFAMVGEIYAEKKQWDQCFDYLDYMIAHQTRPDSFTFSLMLRHFSRHAPIAQVEKLKERMVKEGVLISKHVYWHLLETYARYGEREKVVEMYEAARREFVHPYISMITQYGKWGEPEKAGQVLEIMKDDLHTTGITPGITTYNALMTAFCENQRWDLALNLIDMVKKDKSKYSEDTFNIMLENGLKFQNEKFVIDTYVRMKKLKGREKKELEKQVLDWTKSKGIDLNAEVKHQFWMVWPDFKNT